MDAQTVNTLRSEVLEALRSLDVDAGGVLEDAIFLEASSVGEGRLLTPMRTAPKAKLGIVVADRISMWARIELTKSGWSFFDRRGYMSLSTPDLVVRSDVTTSTPAKSVSMKPNLRTATAEAVVLALLAEPEIRGIRNLARHLEISPAAVTNNLAKLRNSDLATTTNEPLVPELFWELADVWEPAESINVRSSLKNLIVTGGARHKLLGDRHGTGRGWARGGDRVAQKYGFGIQADTSAPEVIYVESKRTLDDLFRWSSQVEPTSNKVVNVRVARSDWVISTRTPGNHVGNVHPLICALDLAQDARGRKALELSDVKGMEKVW